MCPYYIPVVLYYNTGCQYSDIGKDNILKSQS